MGNKKRKGKRKKTREPEVPIATDEEMPDELDEPPTFFHKVEEQIMKAEALLNCAKYSLQYKDDPSTLIDGDDPNEGVHDEIKVLHQCSKILSDIYELVDMEEMARGREERAKAKKRKHK